jgi:hypothetical protein
LIQGDMDCDGQIRMSDFTQFMAYLATGDRGPAPTGCPDPGDHVGQYYFMDADCNLTASPSPIGSSDSGGTIDARDALSLLIEISGTQHPVGCVGLELS